MHARVLRLEQAVFGQEPQKPSSIRVAKEQMLPPTPWSEADGQHEVAFSRVLEDICSGLEDGIPHLTGNLILERKTIEQLASEFVDLNETKSISLPPCDFVLRVLDLYEQTLESAQQIMHVPSVRGKVKDLYERDTRQQSSSDSGLVALLLAMSAHIGFWDTLKWQGLFDDAEHAVKVSTRLAQQAMTALDHARDLSIITVEAIQAAVLLVFLFFHMEGFLTRARVLHSTALTMARELNLHRIDAVPLDPSGLSQEAVIDTETQRKLWWYMVGTDWMLAFNSGPTEGVYTVVPQQMKVNKPRNVTATDLATKGYDFGRSKSEPTNMAYYFFRSELAEICRDAVDSGLMQKPDAVPYERVYELDARFESLIADLPRFLKLDVGSETIKREYGESSGTQIGLQRALTHLMASMRRCKFHLPFLIRYKVDSRFAFSRNACLAAAERLLEVRRVFLDDTSWHTSSYLQLLGIYRYIFYATMVFVMDLCINDLNDSVQLKRVRQALAVVAEAESTSHTAAKFLKALRDVLLKHGIDPPVESQGGVQHDESSIQNQHHMVTRESTTTGNASDASFGLSDFEMLWPDNLANNEFLDSHCWDGLINIDMHLF